MIFPALHDSNSRSAACLTSPFGCLADISQLTQPNRTPDPLPSANLPHPRIGSTFPQQTQTQPDCSLSCNIPPALPSIQQQALSILLQDTHLTLPSFPLRCRHPHPEYHPLAAYTPLQPAARSICMKAEPCSTWPGLTLHLTLWHSSPRQAPQSPEPSHTGPLPAQTPSLRAL